MLSRINLPNRLTLLRALLIPVFVVLMILSLKGGNSAEALRKAGDVYFYRMRIAACIVFCAASITDFLDGYIARKNNLMTDFGKFMDPIADKMLVCSCLILLCSEGSLPSWIVIVIIAREFIISGFRMVAAGKKLVIAASWWGKWKTTFQMILCIYLILPELSVRTGSVLTWILSLVVLVLTVVSLIDYMIKNINVITEGGM